MINYILTEFPMKGTDSINPTQLVSDGGGCLSWISDEELIRKYIMIRRNEKIDEILNDTIT